MCPIWSRNEPFLVPGEDQAGLHPGDLALGCSWKEAWLEQAVNVIWRWIRLSVTHWGRNCHPCSFIFLLKLLNLVSVNKVFSWLTERTTLRILRGVLEDASTGFFSIPNIIFKMPNNFIPGENWECWSVGDNRISFSTGLYEYVKPVKYFQHYVFNLIINGRCILTHLSMSFDTFTRVCSAISFDFTSQFEVY